MYKGKQSLLPPVFNEYFTWRNDVHSHVTHNSAKLHIRQPLNENGKNMLQYQGLYIWNKCLEAVINSQNVITFKKNVKKYYLAIQNSLEILANDCNLDVVCVSNDMCGRWQSKGVCNSKPVLCFIIHCCC